MFLFFDTETTGLPKNWSAPMTNVDNWPRIIQMAWEKTDKDGNVTSQEKHLIKPDGWVVPKEKFWIEHGYSTEECEAKGRPLPEVLDMFLQDYQQSKLLIAHNMNYDYNVTGCEMIRYKKRAQNRIARFCTMMSTIKFVNALYSNGKPGKFPKLEELHRKLFGVDFEGGHDALEDVGACRRSFFELIKRELIKPEYDEKK